MSMTSWEREIADPVRRFASIDRRSGPLFWGFFNPDTTTVEELAREVICLVGRKRLSDLPKSPEFVLCATNLSTGALWRFERNQIGDDVIGYESPPQSETRLAVAVAVSATLLPLVSPFRLRVVKSATFRGGRQPSRGSTRERGSRVFFLADGGVYDNLGLEAVWSDFDVVLVSDGGAPHSTSWSPSVFSRFRSLLRATDVMDQMGRLARRRWFISSIEEQRARGAYWGIGTSVAELSNSVSFPGYSTALVREVIAKIRTDLDAFSPLEQRILENHGYSLASAAAQGWGAAALGLTAPPQMLPMPHTGRHLDEQWIRRELVAGHGRRLGWRG
jgi:NTE family protein